MNIILLRPDDWINSEQVRLADRRHQHLTGVLAVSVGDEVRVGLLGGLCGTGVVQSIADADTVLSVSLTQAPPPRHPFTVVLALPRPKMLRRVLRTCAEFGVTHLHLINSWRVEKSFWQSPLLNEDNINAALQAGLERSGDTLAPAVSLHKRFKPFIEDSLQSIAAGQPIYIAHPGQHPVLAGDATTPALIMIGPEGGFIPYEVELALTHGAEPRAMGQRILSVDTALNAALARAL